MSEAAEQRLRERFENLSTMARNWREIPGSRVRVMRMADELLDQYLDYRDRATEWDADRWGLP